MNQKKMLIVLFINAFLLTGCWNKQELNELSISLALGIDKLETGYEVTVQVVDPSQMSMFKSADRAPITSFSEQADTLFEALRKMTQSTARRVYLSHIHLIIFDEVMAEEGIEQIIDFLLRDHEVRPDFYMVIAKGISAKNVLGVITPLEVLPAIDFYHSLQASDQYTANTVTNPIITTLRRLSKSGISPVLTGLTIKGDLDSGMTLENAKTPISPAHFKYENLGVLKESKLIGWLNQDQANTYNFLHDEIKNMVIESQCPHEQENFVIEIHQSETKRQPIVQNDSIKINTFIKINANLGELHCQTDLKNQDDLNELEKTMSEHITKLLLTSIKSVQEEFQTDIFGFGELVHEEYPKEWQKWKDDWDTVFPTVDIDIDVDVSIQSFGSLVNPANKMVGGDK